MGELLHDAVSVMLVLVYGLMAPLLLVTVQTGTAVGNGCQSTLTEAGVLLPAALVATSPYGLTPAVATESVQELVVDVQPVHV